MRDILRSLPAALSRASRSPPSTPRDLSEDDIRALRASNVWAPSTTKTNFLVLRWFCRWAGNPPAEDESVWVTPHEAPVHGRWLAADQLGRLGLAAEGRERLLVALEGFNGLRRIEVLRL
jgi:hypothetical protein